MAKLTTEPQEFKLSLENREGVAYTGRLVGTLLHEGRDVAVYVAADERVLVHDEDKGRLHEIEDLDDLRAWIVDDEEYVSVMDALGETPEIDV